MLNGLPMRFLSLSLFVAVALAVVLSSGAARAQTAAPSVVAINGTPRRVEPDGSDASLKHPHPSGVLFSDINFASTSAA
jgi:hypothetical protein